MIHHFADEDWAGVKMALISGQAISFKMDLYNPLYINRPVVEPELFASLRPVTYRGGYRTEKEAVVLHNPNVGPKQVEYLVCYPMSDFTFPFHPEPIHSVGCPT